MRGKEREIRGGSDLTHHPLAWWTDLQRCVSECSRALRLLYLSPLSQRGVLITSHFTEEETEAQEVGRVPRVCSLAQRQAGACTQACLGVQSVGRWSSEVAPFLLGCGKLVSRTWMGPSSHSSRL